MVMAVETSQQLEALRTIPQRWGIPDPKYLSQIKRGNVSLDYMDHAQIRAALTAEDPEWTWLPFATTDEGLPKVKIVNGEANLWIWLTVHGKAQPGCGNARADKTDILKELIGDALRNAAMTFGFGLGLWTKQEALVSAEPAALTPPEGPELAQEEAPAEVEAQAPPDPTEAHRERLKERANALPPADRGALRASIDLQHLSWSNPLDLANIEVLLRAAELELVTVEDDNDSA